MSLRLLRRYFPQQSFVRRRQFAGEAQDAPLQLNAAHGDAGSNGARAFDHQSEKDDEEKAYNPLRRQLAGWGDLVQQVKGLEEPLQLNAGDRDAESNGARASDQQSENDIIPDDGGRSNDTDHLLPLHLPPREPGKIPQWFTPEEFTAYIQPLYQRGWHLAFRPVSDVNIVSHVLADRVYTFQNWNEGMRFVRKVDDIAQKENHHPQTLKIEYKDRLVHITLQLQTNTATRCVWAGAPIEAGGTTRRDVRIAMRLEQAYADGFGGGAPSVLPPLARQPPLRVVRKILGIPPKKLSLFCTACGGRHPSSSPDEACRVMDPADLRRLLPLCFKCRQRHAPMARCPKTRDVFVPVAPSAACPNCGGDHWLQDCRKPQLPPEEAKALMLPLMPAMVLEK